MTIITIELLFTDSITGSSHVPGNDSHSGVYCPSNPDSHESFNLNVTDVIPSQFDFFWNQQTVPCFLLVLLPLISLRSISFFTKFNSLGKPSKETPVLPI